MSKEMWVVALGVWITFVPFLGVPSFWRTAFFIITGLVLVVLGLLLRIELLGRRPKHAEHKPFVESTPVGRVETSESPANHHDQKEGINSLN